MLPAYQAGLTLARTLASVQVQSHRDVEIVVVDDGSSDNSADIVRRAAAGDGRIRILTQANGGVAAARNAGIAAARGAWVAPLDADDLWHPRAIELLLSAVQAAPRLPGFAYSWSRLIDADDRVLVDLGQPMYRGDVFARLVASNFLSNASCTLLRRDVVMAAGGFDQSLQAAGAQGAEDLKLYLAVAATEPVEVAPYFLTGYRRLPGSMSQEPTRMRRSIEIVLGDVEERFPDLPPALGRLARMNYDLYAATLALSRGDRRTSLRFMLAGLAQAPLDGAALLGCRTLWRMSSVLRGRRDRPRFADLPEDQGFDLPLSQWFDHRQRTMAERAARRWMAADRASEGAAGGA